MLRVVYFTVQTYGIPFGIVQTSGIEALQTGRVHSRMDRSFGAGANFVNESKPRKDDTVTNYEIKTQGCQCRLRCVGFIPNR